MEPKFNTVAKIVRQIERSCGKAGTGSPEITAMAALILETRHTNELLLEIRRTNGLLIEIRRTIELLIEIRRAKKFREAADS